MLPSTLRPEFRPMLVGAAPVVLAELGWMTMGIVDTLMVGRLGPEAIGAVGVGSSLFIGVVIFAMGLMLGLDALVSRAFGAGDLEAVPSLAAARGRPRAGDLAAVHAGPLRHRPARWAVGPHARRCWS